MLRLMGFLFGSATVLVALLVFADVPALAPYRQVVEDSVSLLLHRLRNAPGSRVSLEAQPPAPKTGPSHLPTPPPEPQARSDTAPAGSRPVAETSPEPTPPRLDMPPPQPRWHVFWNPFRSEFSANGFAERLQQATGMDFRVTRVGPGRYEVAFAYVDEAQRQSGLTRIAAATGLHLEERGR